MAYVPNEWRKWRGRKATVQQLERLEQAVADGTGGGGAVASPFIGVFAVIDHDQDESDLPINFPTAPLDPSGPPPLVFRLKPAPPEED